jgi:hypothetical protein
LRTQRLPSQNDWEEAGRRASSIFGVVAPPLLNAVNTVKLASDIKTVAQQYKIPADQLVPLITDLCQRVGAATTAARIKTARATKTLIDALCMAQGVPLIEALARATVETSASAMGTSLKSCQALGEKLRQTNWQLLEAVRQPTDHRKAQAEEIWLALKDAAQKDEYVVPLESSLRTAESRAIALLAAVSAWWLAFSRRPAGRDPQSWISRARSMWWPKRIRRWRFENASSTRKPPVQIETNSLECA